MEKGREIEKRRGERDEEGGVRKMGGETKEVRRSVPGNKNLRLHPIVYTMDSPVNFYRFFTNSLESNQYRV